jgi:hypothetical protein
MDLAYEEVHLPHFGGRGASLALRSIYTNSDFCVSRCFATIEILGLEGESTNENWTIFLGYQGKFIIFI